MRIAQSYSRLYAWIPSIIDLGVMRMFIRFHEIIGGWLAVKHGVIKVGENQRRQEKVAVEDLE
jgi:hypothetical protein